MPNLGPMIAKTALPRPANAADMERERLIVERDQAIARAEAAEAELHRTLCALTLQALHIEAVERGRKVRLITLHPNEGSA